ncbi:MAG: hypothetical protein E7Z88_02565 [Cyanobacteria bacterium SIG27]|nr:hypothetical protein [Cyanobacteria bacterium SIG27]
MKISMFKFLISLSLLLLPCYASSYVSISPVLTEIIYALSAQDNLFGISSVCNYPEETKEKPIIGDTYFINMEKIIKLKPDYIFSMESNKPMLAPIYQTKTKPIYFEFKNIEDIYKGIEKIAKLTSKENEAKELINDIKNKIEKNKTKKPKKILYIVQFNPLITIGNKSYIDDVIEKSGHINVTSDINFSYPNITLEYVLKSNPDVVILCYNDGIDKIKKLFPKAKIIQLNKEQQDIINRPSPRVWQAIEIFSKM